MKDTRKYRVTEKGREVTFGGIRSEVLALSCDVALNDYERFLVACARAGDRHHIIDYGKKLYSLWELVVIPNSVWKSFAIKLGWLEEISMVTFKPFLLEVTTAAEASALWHRLNLADDRFREVYDRKGTEVFGVSLGREDTGSDYHLWSRVNTVIREMGGLK